MKRTARHRRQLDMVPLRSATREEVVALAQAKAWVIGPDTLESFRDPNSPERRTLAIIDQIVLPGSIDMVVDPLMPRGYVKVRGPVLVAPTTGRGAPIPDRAHAHKMDTVDWGTIGRGVALLILAILVCIVVWGFLVLALTLGPGPTQA